MQPTTITMTIEVVFIIWFGIQMLAPLFETKTITMRDVRKAQGIDVDACDAAWNARKENDNV